MNQFMAASKEVVIKVVKSKVARKMLKSILIVLINEKVR